MTIRNELLINQYTLFNIWSPSRIITIQERLLEEFKSVRENNSGHTRDLANYLSIKFISVFLRIPMEEVSTLSAQEHTMYLNKITQILREHGKC